MDANKTVEVNEAFVAECQMQKCLWGVMDIKIPVLEKMLREPWQNYLKLISIILDSQGFT